MSAQRLINSSNRLSRNKKLIPASFTLPASGSSYSLFLDSSLSHTLLGYCICLGYFLAPEGGCDKATRCFMGETRRGKIRVVACQKEMICPVYSKVAGKKGSEVATIISWASETNTGIGGSYGQHASITFSHPWSLKKFCLIRGGAFGNTGKWLIRKDKECK